MAKNGDIKTTGFTVTLPGTTADLLDWLCLEQETETNRSEMMNICIETHLHQYILEKRPDLAKKTCIVKKQSFFRELWSAIQNDTSG